MSEARMRMTRIPKGADRALNEVSGAPGFGSRPLKIKDGSSPVTSFALLAHDLIALAADLSRRTEPAPSYGVRTLTPVTLCPAGAFNENTTPCHANARRIRLG